MKITIETEPHDTAETMSDAKRKAIVVIDQTIEHERAKTAVGSMSAIQQAALNMPLSELLLTPRAFNALHREGINTVEALVSRKVHQVRDLPNIGRRTFAEIQARLSEHGLSLKP